MEAMGREQGTRLTGDALEDEIEGMVLLQQINLYGFREAIEMFAVLFLFHKIFMDSVTFNYKRLMLDSCFVLLRTHQ